MSEIIDATCTVDSDDTVAPSSFWQRHKTPIVVSAIAVAATWAALAVIGNKLSRNEEDETIATEE